jgi:hypothetical protein
LISDAVRKIRRAENGEIAHESSMFALVSKRQ